MKQKSKTPSFWIILVLNSLLLCLFALTLHIHFETNDDVGMGWIADGFLSGKPDCHLVFINAVYGCVLVFLYELFPQIEWYSVLFCCFQIVSISVLVDETLQSSKMNKSLKIILLFFVYSLWVKLLSNFQFTTTAGIMTFAGCVLINKNEKIRVALGVLLIVVASLIRFEAAGVVALILCPFFVKNFIQKKTLAFVYITIFVVVICLKFTDSLFYRQPQWNEFREYQHCLSTVFDGQTKVKFSNDEMNSMRLNHNDFELFSRYCPDTQVITFEKANSIEQP